MNSGERENKMIGKTVGVYSGAFWSRIPDNGRRTPVALYGRALKLKANPRGEDYMRELFESTHPGGEFVNADARTGWEGATRDAAQVVLLFPDATGIGFSGISWAARKLVQGSRLTVLNGRRRSFPLDAAWRRRLAVRRIIERLMLGEAAALIGFVAMTPVLIMFDLARGRK
jgi:hypothetical protein